MEHILKKACYYSLVAIFTIYFHNVTAQKTINSLSIPGISDSIEIIKDKHGISHIFAKNQADLFFAQGFNAASDRLFQLEIWRRRALGLMAEIQGEKAIKHDIGSRLLALRKNKEAEMQHYHKDGIEIITSFVKGINAYIDQTKKKPGLLPIEFELLGIIPGYWTPEVVFSRHNGLFYGIKYEIQTAQVVNAIGEEKTHKLFNFKNGKPGLKPQKGVDISIINNDILSLFDASRNPPKFTKNDIVKEEYRSAFLDNNYQKINDVFSIENHVNTMGSNNWVISGKKTASGKPLMANDPHRSLQVPSLRYWCHLVAPGWNVIGGGEPALPGLSIGHNQYGAWGLTIFKIDQEDLFVYDINPKNKNQYKYKKAWENMEIFKTKIPVKGKANFNADLKYTIHGPVIYEDTINHKAYAIKASWLEIGTAPYLASLRMDQAKNWDEFREACSYSGTPPENMVWADTEGNIGWQAVGFAPQRIGYDGSMPIPGDGRFDWEKDFMPIRSLPHIKNPESGFFASANQNNVPAGYKNHIGFVWTADYRFNRITEVLESNNNITIEDIKNFNWMSCLCLARELVPLFKNIKSSDKKLKQAINTLLDWDYILNKESIAAGIYAQWENVLRVELLKLTYPEVVDIPFHLSMERTVEWIVKPNKEYFGKNPLEKRDAFILMCLEKTIKQLVKKLGNDMQNWQYGQDKYHHSKLIHQLSNAVNDSLKNKLNIGIVPRGGNSFTINNTNIFDNQKSGATLRIIVDLSNWENSIGTNNPGQSGNPDNKNYSNLYKMWADGDYFPVYYTKDKIEQAGESSIVLFPEK